MDFILHGGRTLGGKWLGGGRGVHINGQVGPEERALTSKLGSVTPWRRIDVGLLLSFAPFIMDKNTPILVRASTCTDPGQARIDAELGGIRNSSQAFHLLKAQCP